LPDICPPEIDQVLALARAGEIATQPPAPLVMGRHLLQAGVTAGPQFKPLLQAAMEGQLEGKFTDTLGGLSFLREQRLLSQSPEI